MNDKQGEDTETQVEDLEAEVQTRGSDSSSEAGSLSSGEGSISSESELGVEFNPANSFIELEGRTSCFLRTKCMLYRHKLLKTPRINLALFRIKKIKENW